eukprot:5171220-Amphidinium_carterae.1
MNLMVRHDASVWGLASKDKKSFGQYPLSTCISVLEKVPVPSTWKAPANVGVLAHGHCNKFHTSNNVGMEAVCPTRA